MYLTREQDPEPKTLGELHNKIYRESSNLKGCITDDYELSYEHDNSTKTFEKEFFKSYQPLKLLDDLIRVLTKMEININMNKHKYAHQDIEEILKYTNILKKEINNNDKLFNLGPTIIIGDWESWEDKWALCKSQIVI